MTLVLGHGMECVYRKVKKQEKKNQFIVYRTGFGNNHQMFLHFFYFYIFFIISFIRSFCFFYFIMLVDIQQLGVYAFEDFFPRLLEKLPGWLLFVIHFSSCCSTVVTLDCDACITPPYTHAFVHNVALCSA